MLTDEDRQQHRSALERTAAEAARHGRRRQVAARLGLVDLALLQWEEWQDEQEWPPERRRDVPTPARGYEDLKALRARVIAQLARERARHAERAA